MPEGMASPCETSHTIGTITTASAAAMRIGRRPRRRTAGTGLICSSRSAASSPRSGPPTSVPSTAVTAHTCQVPGTPFSSCAEKSSNERSPPVTSSRVVFVTNSSPAPPRDITRAPITTAIPWVFLPSVSHSPVCMPTRISIPSSRTSRIRAAAHRIACSGCGNVAKKPSPARSSSLPPKRLRFRADDAVEARQELPVSSVAQMGRDLRRADDVEEQDGGDPTRVGHGEIFNLSSARRSTGVRADPAGYLMGDRTRR